MTETDGAALAEEIRLLVDLVVERAAPWLDGVAAAGHGANGHDASHGGSGHDTSGHDRPGHGASGHGASGYGGEAGTADPDGGSATGSCGWCPLCALIAIARGERPEFVARLLEHAAQLIALLRAVLADRWDPQAGVHMPGFQPERPEPEPAGSPRVQHIAVRRGWDD